MPPSGRPGRSRRKAVLVGGGAIGLAALGAGAFAVYSAYFATGPQPAEVLPASTVGYVSIDLDPSGKQKLEALEALEKFPAFKENVDLDSDDDLRQKLFEMAQDDEFCTDIDFKDDIEPWLGDRFGFAAVDLGKENDDGVAEPTPVGVIQIDDADKAEEGLEALRGCAENPVSGGTVYDEGSGSSSGGDSSTAEESAYQPDPGTGEDDTPDDDTSSEDTFGWSIQDDWVVIAETDDLAEEVTEAAAENPLSDDEDFEKWTDAAGDPGILTAYAAPEAGTYFADVFESSVGGVDYACSASPEIAPAPEPGTEVEPDYGVDDYDAHVCDDEHDEPSAESDAVKKVFEDFDGAALTVRFEDGGLEVETASSVDYLGLDKIYGSDRGDDVVATLPEDTAVAFGVGFEQGWFDDVTAYVDELSGGEFDLEEGLAMIEEETGLSLPEDAETLAGESAAIALGGDFDVEAFESDDPSGLPLGVKIKGDPDEISKVIDKLLAEADAPPEVKDEFGYETDDGYVVAGFSPEFTERLLEDGELGDSDVYQDVVKESEDAAAVLFINFDAGDWLTRVSEGDPEVQENLEPLSALGMSAWTDDDGISHSVIRVTTD